MNSDLWTPCYPRGLDMAEVAEDEDIPQLSAHALAALQEFYAEQQELAEAEKKTVITEDWVCCVVSCAIVCWSWSCYSYGDIMLVCVLSPCCLFSNSASFGTMKTQQADLLMRQSEWVKTKGLFAAEIGHEL